MVLKKVKIDGKERFITLAEKIKPEKFELDDVAQQIFGAVILSTPLSVTEEVWKLAYGLTPLRIVIFLLLTFAVTTIIIYYTKYQKVASERLGNEIDTHIIGKTYIPKRLVSLFIIAYSTTWFVLWLFGVMSYIQEPVWIFKIFIFVSFFAAVGAATADIMK